MKFYFRYAFAHNEQTQNIRIQQENKNKTKTFKRGVVIKHQTSNKRTKESSEEE